MDGVELRPYQHEALAALLRSYREGKRRVLVSLPTGTGKTVVFAHFPLAFKMKKKLLMLAHREELLTQAEQKFRAINPSLKIAIEQADKHASPDAQVVIASVPTIGRSGSARLQALTPDAFSIIVVDEAHHAVAQSYRTIFDHFGLFAPDTTKLLVGFTATPKRADKLGLGEVFQDVSFARDLRQMIAEHYLAPVTGWRVESGTSLDGVKTRGGDFIESQLARVVDTEARNELVVRAFQTLAPSRRGIVFCVNVEHAQAMQRAFAEAGVRAAAVWGDMSKSDRQAVLADFSSGALQVVTNCNLLTEGFDEPRVDCVVMARPTKSKLLYTQMVGRGTRLHADKENLLVIDIADNSRAHEVPQLGSLFNLPLNMNLKGHAALEIEAQIERTRERFPWVDVSRIASPEHIALAVERIEFFNFEPPDEIAKSTRFVWSVMPGGGYRLNLPNGEAMTVETTLLDTFEVNLVGPRPFRLGSTKNLDHAIRAADLYVKEERSEALKLVTQNAEWHDRPPTEKQLALLQRHQVPIPRGLTRGAAARIITLLFARGETN